MSTDPKRQFSDNEKDSTVRKRKYRKHPKPDLNAPKKPSPSAYHLFALDQGEKLRRKGYGFEEIARQTGSLWRALPPQAVNDLETKTTQAKNQYRKDLAAYKKSHEYKAYQDYLKRWMAKEEMKKRQPSCNSKPPSSPENKAAQGVAYPISPNSDDMPGLDWTSTNSSESSDISLFSIPDDWLMPLDTEFPLLPAEQLQLQWKYTADSDVTLAPDPLRALQMKGPEMYTAVSNVPTASTISPTMLTAPTGSYAY